MKQNFKDKFPVVLLMLIFVLSACSQVSEVTDRAEAIQDPGIEAYTEHIPNNDFGIEMIPVQGGTFYMGNEGSNSSIVTVEVSPFWMGKHEITWDLYELYLLSDQFDHINERFDPALADAVSMPSLPYIDPVGGMDRGNNPVINVTQFAALSFTRWLTLKTGHFYRLPTEAEWEYACRAGSETAYHFGDNPDELDQYAWYSENSGSQYHEVGTKQPNALGLHDMLGNVAEWALDQYLPDLTEAFSEGEKVTDPWTEPTSLEPRVVRGGSWNHGADETTCLSRIQSNPGNWKRDDPQIPQSIWWNTNAPFVGFRVVRPVNQPTEKEIEAFWEQTLDRFYYE
ncbi:MAG: SUMF1/EgtB/PvdO family nonheme iron enzyme [Balneolaceae bacterium]|nr:SUMF1/EgtB/PvdO family nonheme iron enzyme [Balneolaceae bacterium]